MHHQRIPEKIDKTRPRVFWLLSSGVCQRGSKPKLKPENRLSCVAQAASLLVWWFEHAHKKVHSIIQAGWQPALRKPTSESPLPQQGKRGFQVKRSDPGLTSWAPLAPRNLRVSWPNGYPAWQLFCGNRNLGFQDQYQSRAIPRLLYHSL